MNYATGSDFLNYALEHQFGELHFKVDPTTGMKAIIAIHSTKLGPALGGCRFIEYENTEKAIYDVMRLARGMSYKAASVNLPLGGGKSVIIKPKGEFNRAAYFHAFGKFVGDLNGRYITALDSGTELSDMDIIAEHTTHVASLSNANGNPSPSTAEGVYLGIKTAVKAKLGKDNLQGLHIAIQGLGHVGFALAEKLYKDGARLTVADVDPHKNEKARTLFQAEISDSATIHASKCDIFSPCALGAILNDETIPQLQCTIVAGAANNQLHHAHHGTLLHQLGILYAPDYVINAGGLIFAASKYLHGQEAEVASKISQIAVSLTDIFDRSQRENQPTSYIADKMAQEKLG